MHRLLPVAATLALCTSDAPARAEPTASVLAATTSLDALVGLAFGAEPIAPAEAALDGAWPKYRFPVSARDGAVTEHRGGVHLHALEDPSLDAVLWGLVVDEAEDRVAATVDGVPGVTLFETAAAPGSDGLILVISRDLATVLTGVFDAPDLAGVPLGLLDLAGDGAAPAVPTPGGGLRPPWPDAVPRLSPPER